MKLQSELEWKQERIRVLSEYLRETSGVHDVVTRNARAAATAERFMLRKWVENNGHVIPLDHGYSKAAV